MKKIYYEKPECEILVVQFEEALLQGSKRFNAPNRTQYLTGGDDDDYEEL